MDDSAIPSIQFLLRQAASLLLYQSVFSNEIGQAFLNLLQSLRTSDLDGLNCLKAYSYWFQALASINQTWPDYLISQILKADNPFTKQVQKTELANLPPSLIDAVKHDLQALHNIYKCDLYQLSHWVKQASNIPVAPVVWDNIKTSETFLHHVDNWPDTLDDLATYYRKFGSGLFAQYRALRWQSGQLVGIAHHDPVKLADLASYESQREAILKNTSFLLSGYPALHILLYGSRGCGKSSLVKSLLNEYSNSNLRLIEVAKSDLKDLSTIIELLRDVPQKFIIFVDDLSFEEDNDAFKSLKVVLEGNLTARPQNVVVYATSNRRHLIREFFGDRPRPSDADEIHAWDTVQEKLSFSDRFGLTLTFEPADQNTYLIIVRHLAAQANINISQEDLQFRALQWATRHNGRSGRTARQFIDFLRSELALSS